MRLEHVLGEELTSKQTWYNGAPPAAVPFARIVGTAICLTNGEEIENGTDPCNLEDGFNPECYVPIPGTREEWLAASAFDRCALQRLYATVIDWCNRGEAARVLEILQAFFGAPAVCRFHPTAGVFPAFATVVCPTFGVAIINGTDNAQQLALQAFYSLTGPQNFGALGTNNLWYSASSVVNAALEADGFDPNLPIMIVGHSYGGATALTLAARYHHARPSRVIRWLTFGCPKIGDTSFVRLLAGTMGFNLANDDDLVTALPPDALQYLPVFNVTLAPAVVSFSSWYRPPFQVQMNSDGSLEANAFPLLDFTTLLAFVQRALASQPLSPISGHLIGEYIERLALRCPDACWPISAAVFDLMIEADTELILGAHSRPADTSGRLELGTAASPADAGLELGA